MKNKPYFNFLWLMLFFLCSGTSLNAQNYNCLVPGIKQYFVDSIGYLRGMRIDSVKTSGTDTIYYPYHTPRGPYMCADPAVALGGHTPLDPEGGSWLGKNPVKHANGKFVFDNMWGDSTIILTKAGLGDSWTFYADTNQITYTASVTAVGIGTVMGYIDSIKTITIYADTAGIANPTDPANGFSLIISQYHGFAQVFDLYTFPYNNTSETTNNRQFFDYYFDYLLSSGYFIDTIGNQACLVSPYLPTKRLFQFKAVDFHDASMQQIYNTNSGDVYQFQFFSTANYSGDSSTYYEDSVTSVSSGTSGNIISSSVVYAGDFSPCCTYYGYSGFGFTEWDATSTPVLDTTYMPEEWGAPYIYFYYLSFYSNNFFIPGNIDSTGDCISNYGYGRFYNSISSTVDYPQYYIYNNPISNCGLSYNDTVFQLNYGVVYTYYSIPESGGYEEYNMTYARKSGNVCFGNYETGLTGIKNIINNHVFVNLIPNPSANLVLVNSDAETPYSLSIYNMLGQCVFSGIQNKTKTTIDVSGFNDGVYLVKITGNNGFTNTNKLLVVH